MKTSSTRARARRRPYAARVPIEDRREQLLDAALRVMLRDGYEAITIEAIAREAGVTRPVVYGAYDGLGALLMALLDRQQVRAFSQLLAALPEELDTSDPLALICGAVEAMVATLAEDPDTWRPILLSPHQTPALVRERIDADRERISVAVQGLVREALGAEVDAEVLGHAVVAILEHFGRLVLEAPEQFGAERLNASVRLVVGALVQTGSSGSTSQ
ncbi:helix-turn-helix domain-containing protein [Nocardioides sp. AE5]|uniref:TetR/AcrR family transcriptional regulator n=1 Tax=Nocardioides sp. AE5 TaxID=2962573 RepID=UPI00288216F6|nr:helix-turn-helix domain-containing protein [Nocardioides sp. AE5]MDT0200683.1 helix-turn-helix domain-containing protein [Nocardioides sp. AE5]